LNFERTNIPADGAGSERADLTRMRPLAAYQVGRHKWQVEHPAAAVQFDRIKCGICIEAM